MTLLARAARTQVGRRQIIDAGGIAALLAVLRSWEAPPERAAQAASIVAGLTGSCIIARAPGAAALLAAVLRHPKAGAEHKYTAMDALSELMRYHPIFDVELWAADAVSALVKAIKGDKENDPEDSQGARARAALCYFGTRSRENAETISRGRGLAEVLAVVMEGPGGRDWCAATTTLLLMAPYVRRLAARLLRCAKAFRGGPPEAVEIFLQSLEGQYGWLPCAPCQWL